MSRFTVMAIALVSVMGLAPLAAAAPRNEGRTVTVGGQVGRLQIDGSQIAAIEKFAGMPDKVVTGSFEVPFLRSYEALAYGCSGNRATGQDPGAYRPAHVYCHTIYFVNPHTRRLAAFWTNSQTFRTALGTRAGITQAAAVSLERKQPIGGAIWAIQRSTKIATLQVQLSGCRRGPHSFDPPPCSGGGSTVIALAVESNAHAVGLFFV